MKTVNIFHKVKRKLIKIYNNPVVIFINHQVSSSFNPETDCRTDWSSTELFRENVNWIMEHFTVISLSRAVEILESGKRIRKKYAVFTFDDAYSSVGNALQILQEKQIPATIFICSAYIGDKTLSTVNAVNYFNYIGEDGISRFPDELVEAVKGIDKCRNNQQYNSYLKIIRKYVHHYRAKEKVYLSDSDLNSLNPDLFTFALHGHEHLNSNLIEDEVFISNVISNKNALQNFRNVEPFFAFPYGYASPEKVHKLREMGYVPFLCNGEKCYKKADAYNRIPIDGLRVSDMILL